MWEKGTLIGPAVLGPESKQNMRDMQPYASRWTSRGEDFPARGGGGFDVWGVKDGKVEGTQSMYNHSYSSSDHGICFTEHHLPWLVYTY